MKKNILLVMLMTGFLGISSIVKAPLGSGIKFAGSEVWESLYGCIKSPSTSDWKKMSDTQRSEWKSVYTEDPSALMTQEQMTQEQNRAYIRKLEHLKSRIESASLNDWEFYIGSDPQRKELLKEVVRRLLQAEEYEQGGGQGGAIMMRGHGPALRFALADVDYFINQIEQKVIPSTWNKMSKREMKQWKDSFLSNPVNYMTVAERKKYTAVLLKTMEKIKSVPLRTYSFYISSEPERQKLVQQVNATLQQAGIDNR